MLVHLENEKKKVEIVYDFSVQTVKFICDCQYALKEMNGWGHDLCSTKDLFDPTKGYIVDGFLTVNFNGIFMVETDQPTLLSCENLLTLTETQMKQDKDFSIEIGDKEVKVSYFLITIQLIAFCFCRFINKF